MPVSCTATTTPSRIAARAARRSRPPSGVNLTALESRLSRICLNLRSSAIDVAELRVAPSRPSAMPCRCARSRISVIALEIADGRSKVARSSSMRPASTFDRSRMSLISEQQVPAGRMDVLQVVVLLFVELAEDPLEQHFGKADDRVQRRAQLVRHVGEELRLVLVGDLELRGSCPGSRGTGARSRARSRPGRRRSAARRFPGR